MLTLDDIIKTQKHKQACGLTGKHVFGRGSERLDGTFSDEAKIKSEARKRELIFGKDGSRRKPAP